jgi:hypothetical protein
MPPSSKQDKKLPPSSGSPEKHNKAMKPPFGSPPNGRKSKAEILKSKEAPAGWYLRSALLQGGLELITITTQTMVDDAFFQNLITKINEGDDSDPICQLGFIGAYFMRISLNNPNQLINGKGKYQRRALIRVLDDGEEGDDSRLAALKVVKEFLEQYHNNKYGTPVFVLEPGWNMTASLTELPKTDHYLQYSEIVKIIKKIFDGVNNTWATDNPTAAECYFTAGHIPFQAMHDLGFPESKVMTFDASIGN